MDRKHDRLSTHRLRGGREAGPGCVRVLSEARRRMLTRSDLRKWAVF